MTKKRILRATLVAGLVGLLGAGMASASTDVTDVTIIGGSLSSTDLTVANFSSVTLDGTAKNTTGAASDFTVTDARGNGNGWNVTVAATQFCKMDALNLACDALTPRSLPTSSLSVPQFAVSKADSTSSAVPGVTAGPYLVDGASIKVASAAADGSGMGSYTFAGSNWNLTVPASAYAETYRSTVTMTVASGP